MITARTTSKGTHFVNRGPYNTTAIDIRPLHKGSFTVIIESWSNLTPGRPYYSNRVHALTRRQALDWVRTMLPLPIMR